MRVEGPGLAGMSCGPRRWRLLCTHRQDGHRAAHVLLAPAQALAIALGKHDGAWAWPPIRLGGCTATGTQSQQGRRLSCVQARRVMGRGHF